jgi:Domain of unknown function (DUF4326)
VKRIQRQRTKGWRMPEGAIYVGRPTRWGNGWHVGQRLAIPGIYETDGSGKEATVEVTPALAVVMYRAFMSEVMQGHPAYFAPLRGHDLACWCPLDQPCHADVLIELLEAA